jgi:uncharacterized repeat protein (TIGR01451 family)
MRFGLALALASVTELALRPSPGGAARSRTQANVTIHLAGPATVAAGDNPTYTLTIRNNGPQARGVVVRDRLPAGVTPTSATPSKGSCSGTAVVTCALGRMNHSAVARVTIVERAERRAARPASARTSVTWPCGTTRRR